MDDKDSIRKILKWAGIVALVALPVYLIVKKGKSQKDSQQADDESNIFSSELD
jgi:uncharacterized membrane protein YjfL (UPF0719 family)